MPDNDSLEVEHTHRVSESLGSLLFDERTSDLTLIVGGEQILAHRAILASSCNYFSSLLYGDMRERDMKEIVLEDVPPSAFKLILRYIYTGILKLSKEHSLKMVIMVLSLAHLYGIEELQSAICRYLGRIITAQNVLIVLEAALLREFTDLEKCCRDFIDENAEEIIQSEPFSELSAVVLEQILSQDALCVKEIEVFKAVELWISRNPSNKGVSNILAKIRLPLIGMSDLTSTVIDSGLFSSDRLLNVIKEKINSDAVSFGYRCFVENEVNIATPERGTEVLVGSRQPKEQVSGLDLPSGTWHDSARQRLLIDGKAALLVRLGKPYVVNHIMMSLDDSSKYYVEVSLNGKDWFRVIDYSMYLCHSHQELFFEAKVVRYIRVVGSPGSDPDEPRLLIEGFKAFFTRKPLKLKDGIVIPEVCVSSPRVGALIYGDKGSLGDALISGTSERDPERKVFHTLRSEFPLVIKFRQPYIVDSLRILFWDGTRRLYCYFVEVSADGVGWIRVATFSGAPNEHWQVVKFEPSAVLFIKIDVEPSTGFTDGLRSVDIECPFVGCDNVRFQLDRLP